MAALLKPSIILGSSSLERLELIKKLPFKASLEVFSPAIDETLFKREKVDQAVIRLATEKIRVTHQHFPHAYCVCADTLAACSGRILEKTADRETARYYLSLLSGKRHTMATCVCVAAPHGKISYRLVKTQVSFKRLTPQEIEQYLSSEEWVNCAGGYSITGQAERFIKRLNGSYSNVRGLPLYETQALLQGLGFKF